MIHYNKFNITDDIAYNISFALDYCKEHNEDKLVFDNGIYRIKSDLSSEGVYSVSNHTNPGFKRICFLLRNFENFTIDGGGSEFIFEDLMTAFVVDDCKNVKIENFKLSSLNTQNCQCEVVDSGNSWALLRVTAGCDCYADRGDLYTKNLNGNDEKLLRFIECDKSTGKLVPWESDYFLTLPDYRIVFTEDNGLIRAEGLKRKINVGNTLVFSSVARDASMILINESTDTHIHNVAMFSGMGMGVIAQNCNNIEINCLSTEIRGIRRYSINADATHFVHCDGNIIVKNSCFEGQLDDAMNVHSIYLKVELVYARSVIAKFSHWETKGIKFIKPGSIVQISDAETQLSINEYVVKSVKYINIDYVVITFEEDILDIAPGMLIDEISSQPQVVFENNIVRNNRARGILLGSPGKTVIKNNVFESPGNAILFESSGDCWFESGGVGDVEIVGNRFINCKYAKWGKAIIETVPKKKIDCSRYFHKRICIEGNIFEDSTAVPAIINNTEECVYRNNEFINCCEKNIICEHCKTVINN